MNPGVAHLIARMQVALVSEGVLHSMDLSATTEEYEAQMEADQAVIRLAVTTAWPMLKDGERRVLRGWKIT